MRYLVEGRYTDGRWFPYLVTEDRERAEKHCAWQRSYNVLCGAYRVRELPADEAVDERFVSRSAR